MRGTNRTVFGHVRTSRIGTCSGRRPPQPMSASGHKRTSSTLPIYVCFRLNSGHRKSAFRERCNFLPVMSACGRKADVIADLSACLLIAISGHSLELAEPILRGKIYGLTGGWVQDTKSLRRRRRCLKRKPRTFSPRPPVYS